jgi:NAD(P)-dependent dehydrogenase (short-subunit alcohol dehydrogenase family)
VETALFGAYHGVRAALPWLREQGEGTIVNVSSVLGKIGSPHQSAYVAAKHGIQGLSASVRQELRDVPGIRVCTVLPGSIDTPLFQQAGNYTGRRAQPLAPVIRPERVARAVVRCIR